jgi:hypothetical protein
MKSKNIKLKNILSENTPGYKDRKFGAPLPTLEDIQTAHNAKQDLKEGPNAWRRMDGLHNLKLMKQIETNTATLVKEFSEEGFEEEDIRAWFDRQLIKVIKKNM